MMDTELYIRKIGELSDEKLKELLQLRTKENAGIMNLAAKEAVKRGIDLQTIPGGPNTPQKSGTKGDKDKGVSWADVLADILSGLS